MDQDVELALPGAARDLYDGIADLPIVSPHGHTNPAWFAEDAAFGNPADLLIRPDHYVFRMLHSRGIPLDALGIGGRGDPDPRAAFRLLAEHWHAFLGTPSHLWMSDVLARCFDVTDRLSPATADAIYDRIDDRLRDPAFRPRALLERFGIEVLATTDAALDDLAPHAAFAASDHPTRLIPTFRPDALLNPETPGHATALDALADATGGETDSYGGFLDALRARRAHFRAHGATATDHAIADLRTHWLPRAEAETLYAEARRGGMDPARAARLHGHLLTEMAQMSRDDGLVMQLHAGARRDTDRALFDRLGPDRGADIPMRTDWVGGLDALLNRVGAAPGFALIAFTLDESAYARELAPMAGHWPALRLGPPWWFHDSPNGIRRWFDAVVETAGYGNLAGFNDDTRAFLSIPARHDMWRRAVALHLSGQVARGLFHRDDAERLARRLARDLAVEAYRLDAA